MKREDKIILGVLSGVVILIALAVWLFMPSYDPIELRDLCQELNTIGSTAEDFEEWIMPRDPGELPKLLSCMWEKMNGQ